MKLTVLVDNNTYIDQYYLGEPAFCCLLEAEGKKILFDTGYSDIFLKNAEKMGVDLNDLTHIALSHGHNDHTRGLLFLPPSPAALVAHPDCFLPKLCDGEDIGAPFSAEEAAKRWDVRLTREPVALTEHLLYLGQIPRTNDFENRTPIGTCGGAADFLLDDTALVWQRADGIFIITGCSHSGICNIVEYAKKLCGDDRVLGILGGFHLLEAGEQLDKTVAYLAGLDMKMLYPCHCVCLQAKAKMLATMPVTEVGVGMALEL